ncbi:cation diffusion facilitator family transporter [Parasphaerochaeta coccoides]|nr:cation diffusion facilitator family transporter [Parasphaerochaeta coccoides]
MKKKERTTRQISSKDGGSSSLPARKALAAAFISTFANALLSIAKLVAGIMGGSAALVSDAVNSLGDVASSLLVIGGVAVSRKQADREHQYGHEKAESIVSLFLALALVGGGIFIGIRGVELLLNPESIVIPTLLPLAVAAGTMVSKEVLYRYTKRVAKATGSSSLEATAWDHRSDVFSALGVFVGILGARLGMPVLEPIASLLICLLILKAGVHVLMESINVLLDASVDEKTRASLKSAIKSINGVLGIDLLKTRRTGFGYYVEVEIRCDSELSLRAAHNIAEDVHHSIEHQFPCAKHVTVHVNPAGESVDGTFHAPDGNVPPPVAVSQNSPPSSSE